MYKDGIQDMTEWLKVLVSLPGTKFNSQHPYWVAHKHLQTPVPVAQMHTCNHVHISTHRPTHILVYIFQTL